MDFFKNHQQWDSVNSVIEILLGKGYTAWLAGGCVRDYLLKRPIQDFDIVTNATPDVVVGLFENAIEVGKQFGVIIVPFKDFQVEVATFRSDVSYVDGRHPTSVVFSTPEEDALRRDFTINAMFYDTKSEKLHDFVEGQKDLKAKVIRAVGNPLVRFEEDKLRILRAVRFSCQLGFEIEEKTFKDIARFTGKLSSISKERIQHELNKILTSTNPVKGFELLKKLNLLNELFPIDFELNWGRTLILLNKKGSLSLMWAQLIYYNLQNKDQIRTLLKTFKFSNQFEAEVIFILDLFNFVENIKNERKGKALGRLYTPYTEIGLKFCKNVLESENKSQENYQFAIELQKEWKDLPKPLLTGEHLIGLNIKPGAAYKEILQEAYYLQLEKKYQTVTELLNWAKALKKKEF